MKPESETTTRLTTGDAPEPEARPWTRLDHCPRKVRDARAILADARKRPRAARKTVGLRYAAQLLAAVAEESRGVAATEDDRRQANLPSWR